MTNVWTFADDGRSAADQYDAEVVLEDHGGLEVYFDGTSRRVPLDVVAELLRVAGYKVVSPKAQSELGR